MTVATNEARTAAGTLSPHLKDLEDESIHILREVAGQFDKIGLLFSGCLLYTSPSPRDGLLSRMPSSA